MNAPLAASPLRTGLAFALQEVKGLLLAFWRPFWVVTLAAALLLLALFGYATFAAHASSTGGQSGQEPPLIGKLAVIVALSLWYALFPGVAAGAVGAAWRLCGWGILVPAFLIPAAVVLSVWLCSGWIAGEGRDAAEALADSARANGFPRTEEAAGGVAKAGHGGVEVLAVIGVLLLPFFCYDALWVLLDGTFLWQFAEFLLALLLAVLLGLVPSAALSLAVLSFAIIGRMRRRYRAFVGAA